MTPIAKDTPVGTRVLVVRDDRSLLRTVTRSQPWEMCGQWVISVNSISGGYAMSRVYLDEPEPGTWDWACRAALAGNTVRSKSAEAEFWYDSEVDAFVKRGPGTKLEIANPSKAHVLATDWEVVE